MTSVSIFSLLLGDPFIFFLPMLVFVPFGSRGPVARPFERMGVANPMPNLPSLSELGTGKVGPKMEFQSCTGTRLCPRRGMLNLTGN